MSEYHHGLDADTWYHMFQEKGMGIFDSFSLLDHEIIVLLGRCCVGRECITPVLKKENWSLERFVKAQETLGFDEDGIAMFVGEFSVLDDINYKPMTPLDMRMYINKTYTWEQLTEMGHDILKTYK